MSTILDTVRPPVPDPEMDPKTADEIADEGDREGPVLQDGTRPDAEESEVETERDPQFARNGE